MEERVKGEYCQSSVLLLSLQFTCHSGTKTEQHPKAGLSWGKKVPPLVGAVEDEKVG